MNSNPDSRSSLEPMTTRRTWLLAALSSCAGLAASSRFALAAQFDVPSFQKRIRQIEEFSNGGRLGVALLDTSTEKIVGYNLNQRFPMCSTFKILLVGAVLKRVDQRAEKLDRIVHFTQKDLVPYSPA